MLELFSGRPQSEEGRLDKEIRTYDYLDRLGIAFERIDHEPANTMAACEAIDEALSPAVICKNLFLCNAGKTQFYLLLLRGDKKFKTASVSKQLGVSRLSFAPEEFMEEFLNITPGSVSIMGLMNDTDRRVELIVDEDVLGEEYFACHPCINTSSIRMKTEQVFHDFVRACDHPYRVVKVEESTNAIQ